MVVTHSIFDMDFPNNVMHDLRCSILNFDGSKINSMEGYYRTMAFFNGQQCSASIYVADDSCELVIGWDLLTRLGMTVEFGSQTVRRTEPESSPRAQQSEQIGPNSQPHSNSSMSSNLSEGTSFCSPQVSSLSLNSLVQEVPEPVRTVINQLPNLTSKEIGTFPDGQHWIQLSADAIPVAVKTRPIPYAIREKVADAIHLLDKQGIWEPADKGDWVHPLMMPAKSDGMVRIMTDLSRLNKFIIPMRFDVPMPVEIFQMVRGSKFFSTLDLMKAYHHILLAPESRPLTLMMMPLGPRQYVKLPLGLKDSRAIFQWAIHETLKDCPGVVPYVDDILVYGITQAKHDQTWNACCGACMLKIFPYSLANASSVSQKCHS